MEYSFDLVITFFCIVFCNCMFFNSLMRVFAYSLDLKGGMINPLMPEGERIVFTPSEHP